MLQKAMYFLQWGQFGIKFFEEGKKVYTLLKWFFLKKRKYALGRVAILKKQQKMPHKRVKKMYVVLKAYCSYMQKLVWIIKNRLK